MPATSNMLTPEQQARRDYWARVHIASDRSEPVSIDPRRIRRLRGSGVRYERGGFTEQLA